MGRRSSVRSLVLVVVASLLATLLGLVPDTVAATSSVTFEPADEVFEPANAPPSATLTALESDPVDVDTTIGPGWEDTGVVEPDEEGASQPDAIASEIARLAPGDEVVALRAADAKVFVTDEPGVLRAQVASVPVHYRRFADERGVRVPDA